MEKTGLKTRKKSLLFSIKKGTKIWKKYIMDNAKKMYTML